MSKKHILDLSIKQAETAGEHTPESAASVAANENGSDSQPAPVITPSAPAAPADGTQDRKPGETVDDYKKRLDDSKREALRLLEENRAKDARIAALEAEAEQNADLTLETELRKLDPEWDTLDESEKASKLETARANRKAEKLESENAKLRAEKQFDRDFANLVLDPAMELLKGEQEPFRQYAAQYPNTDLAVLARSFLYAKHGERSALEAAERTSRQGLEAPTGGAPVDDTTRSSDGYTEEALRVLANSNPREFNRIMKKRATLKQARGIAGR